jgi:hypothetical protein
LIPFTKESFNEVSKHRPRRARRRPDYYLFYDGANLQGQAKDGDSEADAYVNACDSSAHHYYRTSDTAKPSCD